MKKLSIIITHYNEPFSLVQPMLDSIKIQRSVNLDDIEVIIVNDGRETLLPHGIYDYPFTVRYVVNEKANISVVRNRGLDEAQGEYVMFCDCDDQFYTSTALYLIFNEIGIGFDGLVDNFLEETKHPETGQFLYLEHANGDSTFVHGAVWKKSYLTDNNIRFDDTLSVHEDSRFKILAMNCSTEIKYCPVPIYLWCWNDNSVCRRDPKYLLKTYNNMLDSNSSLVRAFLERDMKDKAKFYGVMMIWDSYYSLCSKEWKDINNQEYRDSVEKRFKDYLKEFKPLWDDTGEQDKLMISNGVRQRVILEGRLEMENITIEEFLKKYI